MKMRLSLLMTVVLGSSLSLAAVNAFAQEPPPGGPHSGMGPGIGMAPGTGEGMERHEPPRPRFSPGDRAAFFDAHLAGLHAGLKLTPDQEKLWPAVETALRAGAKAADARIEARHTGPRPANAIAWLRKLSDEDIAKGETLKALADAAAPLYETLNEDQKRRLPFLLHGIRPHGFGEMGPHHDRNADEEHEGAE